MDITIRVCLALVFGYSSYAKARSWRHSSPELVFLSGKASVALMSLTILVEASLAIVVIAWPHGPLVAPAGIVVLVGFTLYYGIRLVMVGDTSCACFGAQGDRRMPEERSLIARVGAVAGHALGNGVLILLWVASTRNGGTLVFADISTFALLPPLIVTIALVSDVVRAKVMMRRPIHPTARSMTVDTVRLGRCKRLASPRWQVLGSQPASRMPPTVELLQVGPRMERG